MTAYARREPLLVRPGARFECMGDGLCCSDIHAVGALTEDDCRMLSLISEDAFTRYEGQEDAVLLMRSDTGRCVFSSENGCLIHHQLGPHAKPSPCIQFPYALTATPMGGRISTQHRCTCRTLGPLPPITAEAVRPSLVDAEGELKFEHIVLDEVRWRPLETLSFEQYAERERPLLEALSSGEQLMTVLQAPPLPTVEGLRWAEVAEELRGFQGSSRAATAARWFGDALGFLNDRRPRTERSRPWADAFERAATRIVEPVSPNVVFGDWLADELWSLRWTRFGSLARARAEWSTRLAIARRIAGWLDVSTPLRDNVSAAEAVMIVDVVGSSEPWERAQEAMRDAPTEV